MNARQARRLALWLNGQYMRAADHTGLSDEMVDAMSEEDITRIKDQQTLLGHELIERSGIDPDITTEEAVVAVLSPPLPRFRR